MDIKPARVCMAVHLLVFLSSHSSYGYSKIRGIAHETARLHSPSPVLSFLPPPLLSAASAVSVLPSFPQIR